jgi:hypothetical protein
MIRKTKIDHKSVTRILRTVPTNNAFLFFTDISEYTGVYATSLRDFYNKLEKIPISSIAFHFARGDYEKWSEDTLGDTYLARVFGKIKKPSDEEKLRKSIQRIVQRRLNQLEK